MFKLLLGGVLAAGIGVGVLFSGGIEGVVKNGKALLGKITDLVEQPVPAKPRSPVPHNQARVRAVQPAVRAPTPAPAARIVLKLDEAPKERLTAADRLRLSQLVATRSRP